MFKLLLRSAAIVAVLVPSLAAGEPIKLKLAFALSDRTSAFVDMVKPFVDAVNADARNLIEIQVYSSGVLGKALDQQAQMVLSGTADIAFVIPSANALSDDNSVVELPGLYQGLREASVIFTRLVAANALRGYDDFYVIGAFATEPESIHARKPIASLDDLKGLKIRSSSSIEAAAFTKLGIRPVIMPAPAASDAISSGMIDGAAIAPALLQEFGIGRVTSNHYLLRTSAGPLTLLMNRNKFDSLPEPAQMVIRKYSGEWAAARFADGYEKLNTQAIEQLRSDSRRKVVVPTQEDLKRAQQAFKSVISEWVEADGYHGDLLKAASSEVLRFRADSRAER